MLDGNQRKKLSLTFFLHQTTTGWQASRGANILSLTFFLHQTTTVAISYYNSSRLSLTFFLHQTTTVEYKDAKGEILSLTFFLHQTTTLRMFSVRDCYCLLPFFYIKPQQPPPSAPAQSIVSYLFSTSNHNVYLLFCCFTKTYNVKRIHEVVEINLSPCKGTKKIPIAMGLA